MAGNSLTVYSVTFEDETGSQVNLGNLDGEATTARDLALGICADDLPNRRSGSTLCSFAMASSGTHSSSRTTPISRAPNTQPPPKTPELLYSLQR